MITQFKTYGKAGVLQRIVRTIKDRFRVNPYTERILIARGLRGYIPKLNRVRVALSMVGVVFCVAVPFITPLSIFVLWWGLK